MLLGEYLGTSLMVKIYVFDLRKSFTFNVYDDIKKLSGKYFVVMLLTTERETGSGENTMEDLESLQLRKYCREIRQVLICLNCI